MAAQMNLVIRKMTLSNRGDNIYTGNVEEIERHIPIDENALDTLKSMFDPETALMLLAINKEIEDDTTLYIEIFDIDGQPHVFFWGDSFDSAFGTFLRQYMPIELLFVPPEPAAELFPDEEVEMINIQPYMFRQWNIDIRSTETEESPILGNTQMNNGPIDFLQQIIKDIRSLGVTVDNRFIYHLADEMVHVLRNRQDIARVNNDNTDIAIYPVKYKHSPMKEKYNSSGIDL